MNNRYARFWAALVVLVFSSAVPASSHAATAQYPLNVTVDVNSVTIRAAAATLLKYRYGDVPFKPYVSELFTPSGLNVLLDAPPDHLHHHGLMFAVAADGVNFWEETPTAGRQFEDAFVQVELAQHGGGPSASFFVRPGWVGGGGGKEELTEHRTIDVCQISELGATVVIWRSDLAVPKAKSFATLSGSHYFGLGMRFVRSMDGGEFFNASGEDGTVFRGEERLVAADWCAYTGAIEGKPVTVAMLGHPSNPRHPTTWFMMAKPFAYLSATLNLHEQRLVVKAGERLVLRWAVLAWDGRTEKERVDEAYQWLLKYYWAVGRLKAVRREAQIHQGARPD
jgi:hypothetical protein